MKKNLIYLFLLLSLVSCEREKIQGGLFTSVQGKLTDETGAPIVNAPVRIGEYTSKFVSDGGNLDIFSRFIASTVTDSNGNYKVNFLTTGQGTLYKVHVENDPPDQSYKGFNDPVTITTIGAVFSRNFQFITLYPCDVTINVGDLTYFPVGIWHDTTRYVPGVLEITGSGIFFKRIYINNFAPQELQFYRNKPDGTRQGAKFTFPTSNTQGATMQQITLSDANFTAV